MRIVSLSPSVTDALATMGLGDHVVGATPFCLTWLRGRGPGSVEIVGDYLRVDVGKLKLLRPDVVFLQSRVHDRFYGSLRGLGFNVRLVGLPETVMGALSELVKIADAVGAPREGRELALGLARELAELAGERAGLPEGSRPRVYVEYLWPDWTYTAAGAFTFVNDMVWLAGGLNVFHGGPAGFFRPGDEELAALRPQVVLVNVEPGMRVDAGGYLRRRGAVRRLAELHGTRVHLVPESRDVNLAHWGPSTLVRTVARIAELLGSQR